MKNEKEISKFITIKGKKVDVVEEVYDAYRKFARRMRYHESDIKVGRIEEGSENGTLIIVPSKEDSIERLEEQGVVFQSEEIVEDIVLKNIMLQILEKANKSLNKEEQELINALYVEKLTTREFAKKKGISHVAVVKRHKKIIDKLKKHF
ncbi:MAG: sigma-70 family RNA polymerase sigma factor [Alkaliphilus sp.]